MMDYIEFLFWPFLICLATVAIHAYFGLHVIKRGIIFVDLSLAQIAGLGMTMAFLLGYEPEGTVPYLFSLGFAFVGAIIFTFARGVKGKVPQEAIIGIVYAVSAAASILAVSHSPEGSEHIEHLLIGSILTVTPDVVLSATLVFGAIGLFHWLARSRFIPLTFGKQSGPSIHRVWDFLFYATFAIMVTTAVKICGVLLVFIFLVVPGVFGSLVAEKFSHRLILAWIFGIVSSVLGLVSSFWLDTPTGATIVCAFGLMLLLYALYRGLRPRLRAR